MPLTRTSASVRLPDTLGDLGERAEAYTAFQARLDVPLEQRAQHVVEAGDAVPELGIGERGHVGPLAADLEDQLAVVVVLGQAGGAQYLLHQPRACFGLVLGVIVEVAALAVVAGDAGHVAEVLPVDRLRAHPGDAHAEQPHQRHVDVQVAVEGRNDVMFHGGVVDVVIPDAAVDEGVAPPGLQVVLEARGRVERADGVGKYFAYVRARVQRIDL